MHSSLHPNFLDTIPDSYSHDVSLQQEAPILERCKPQKESLRVPSIFNKIDFQIHENFSTSASMNQSQLEVPEVFNRSSFLLFKPLFGSQLFALFKFDCFQKPRAGTLLSLVVDLQDSLQLFQKLEDLFNHEEIDSLYIPTKDSKQLFEATTCENEKCYQVLQDAHNENYKAVYLFKLRIFIHLKYPTECALLKFSSPECDLTQGLAFNNTYEIFLYILIFYYIVAGKNQKIEDIVDTWIEPNIKEKSLSNFYVHVRRAVSENLMAF
jgi:hypothetical protein